MSFKKNGYSIIRQAVDLNLVNFIYRYFILKRKVAESLFKSNYISPFTTFWGIWKDEQVPNTYSNYADIAAETLLTDLKEKMETETGLELVETYAYTRIYKNGDLLYRHKDRFSCEISTTLSIGGDLWPIYIDPTGEDNILDVEFTDQGEKPTLKETANKGIKVELNPGDMLVYKGNLLEHWREAFKGDNCCQIFLHYNNKNTEGSEKNKFDGRPHLGLPSDFKK